MAILTSLVLFLVLLALITHFGYRYYARPARYYQHLAGGTMAGAHTGIDTGFRPEGMIVRVIHQIGAKVPVSPQGASLTRRLLMAAGYRNDSAPAIYHGLRVLTFAGLTLTAFFFRSYVSIQFTAQMVFVALVAFVSLLLPGLIVERMVTKRHEDLKLSLPDALDLMVVCVEAGLGLDQAVVNVGRELANTHQALSEEFSLVSLEMQAGKRRAEALRNLADRTGEAEIRKLVAVLIQTDRFGTSMADSLRTHSEFMRVRRKQEAEERANKVGVKLVFPIFFCILPSMIIVVAGPGLIQVLKYLFPLLRDFKG